MTLPEFDILQPKTLKAACRLLAQEGDNAKIIAGGTEILPALKNRLKALRFLVDLSAIPGLQRLTYSQRDGLRIGAMVTLHRLATAPIVKERYPVLAQAALAIGSRQLQAMGTVAGNLCQDNLCIFYNRPPSMRQGLAPCWKLGGETCHVVHGSKQCWATYCGDLAPALLTLGARVVIADPAGQVTVPLSQIYSDDASKPIALKAGQVITEIQVPTPSPGSAGLYLKLRQRQAIDYPLVGVAVHLNTQDGLCQELAIGLTAVGKSPLTVQETELVKGRPLGEEEIGLLADAAWRQAHPLNNIVEVSPAYRREMVRVYVKRALRQLIVQA